MFQRKSIVQQNSVSQVSEVEIHYLSKVKPSERKRIIHSHDAYEILMEVFNPRKIEHKEMFYCVYLNRAKRVLAVMKISEGGITATVVDMRIIFQAALVLNATSFILSHNHPSGNLVPSHSDDMLTERLKNAGLVMDIDLTDHIIVSPETNRYYSYSDEGKL